MDKKAGVLERIVAQKRADVAARERRTPMLALRLRAAPPPRSLRRALAAPGARFILECKKASPSAGLLRPDFDPEAIAAAYAGVADAVSVVTEEAHFEGSLSMLQTVRARVSVPVLCKDFVVSPYQVVEARAHGADAILLMLSVLDDETARACLRAAAEVGMECLVEVHDEAELKRALAMPAPILGINSRDMRTLEVDLGVVERLAPRVPADRIVVAESGVTSRADVDRLARLVDGFLVGSALMRQPDLVEASRALIYGRVKICGLTRPVDAAAAARAGACFGGLVFAEKSPRRVTRAEAEAIAREKALPLVGVFVDEPVARVADAARALGLLAVQLNGREDEGFINALRPALPEGCAVWKAVHLPTASVGGVGGSGAGAAADPGAEPGASTADRLLFDTISPVARGGTGLPFDWRRVADHPRRAAGLLAGGLNVGNIVAARSVGTWALDLSSGVENAPGEKCPVRMERLFERLRGPCRREADISSDRSPGERG